MINKIEQALKYVDVLVTTGSVSMGDRDLLKPILEKCFKATIHFGTPFLFLIISILIHKNIHIFIIRTIKYISFQDA